MQLFVLNDLYGCHTYCCLHVEMVVTMHMVHTNAAKNVVVTCPGSRFSMSCKMKLVVSINRGPPISTPTIL